MASYRAISAVSTALVKLLEANCPVLLAPGSTFDLYGPTNYDTPMRQGLSLMLYRVTVNSTQRNRAPRHDAAGRKLRPSLPVDLHYLLTAWAPTPALQYMLLGWALRFLEDRNVLPASVINLYDAEQHSFLPDEAVEIVNDALPLNEHLQMWDKLKTRLPVSLTYVVRMVAIDSEVEMPEGAAVRTRGFAEPAP